jgi:hypothetical protein
MNETQATSTPISKVKIDGKIAFIIFNEETCTVKIDGRDFTFANEERVCDVFIYIANELS